MSQANDINAKAAEWVARVDAAALSPAEKSELDLWLAANPRHFGAYERLQAIRLRLHRVKGAGRGLKAIAPNSSGPFEQPLSDEDDVMAEERSGGFSRRAAIAAGVSGILMLGMFGWRSPVAAQTFRTARGEVRRIPLDDGSTITLNTASAMTVRPDLRSIVLLEGEAFLQVRGDLHSPFKLSAGRMELICSQTKFCIHLLSEDQSILLIQQGAVDMAVGDSERLLVKAGTKAVLDGGNKLTLSSITARDLERQLLWREGMISFSDTTLFDAAATFRRYSDIPLVITDPQVGQLTITGVYSGNDLSGFLQAVAKAFDLGVQRTGRGYELMKRSESVVS